MTRAVRRRTRRTALATVLLAIGATSCAPASPSVAPSGVDNPWVAVDAIPGPVVAGVTTTAVPAPGVAGVAGAVDYYAQDGAGNVWWFGREDVWTLDDPGARAGLVITATPRRGDGYRAALAPASGVDLVAEVADVDAAVQVGTTAYDDSVVVDVRDLVSGLVERSWFVEGVGRVRTEVVLAS